MGSPIAHSLSPALHRAAFEALGLTGWRSVAIEVPVGSAPEALGAFRAAHFTGLSVTMPHKADVADLVDDCSERARKLRAVNCIVARDTRLYGASTDGEGFVASLVRGANFSAQGQRCVVIGAGGAARAVILALAEAGAARVTVMNRTPGRAHEAAALAGAAGDTADLGDEEAVAQADLVVNATPVGLIGTGPAADSDEWPVTPVLLHPGQLAVDLVYDPRPTAWLVAAGRAGAATLDGLGMLVHQAAAQLELWTGVPAPLDAMWQAVTR
jgi:shikimate dehydrogenase